MPTIVLAVMMILMPPAMTPDPGPPAPEVIATFLGFSDAQRTGFDQLLQNFRNAVSPLQPQLQQKQAVLEALLSSDQPDPAVVGAALLQVRAVQKQLDLVAQIYHGGFVSLLTDDQKQKVQAVAQGLQLLPAIQAFVGVHLLPAPQ